MKKNILSVLCILGFLFSSAQSGRLKYIIYDFDGLDIGQTDLPDGDFGGGDLQYSIDGNPLSHSDVIGDRVLRLKLNWSGGAGHFGKSASRFLELVPNADQLHFYIYNPTYNSGAAQVQVAINEDDNGNNISEYSLDDKWIFNTTVPTNAGWQLVSIPLSSFTDENAGGNGAFDASYTGAAGMLHSVSLHFTKPGSGSTSDQYYIDMICFTEGSMPYGSNPLELPVKGGGDCLLGALSGQPSPDQVPAEIHGFLPGNKRLSFVNWFLYYATFGTTPNKFPGNEVQNLLDQDITPIITWEAMFAGYSRLDPAQPRLNSIINGSYDSYIDAFAAKIKTYTKPVILRIFHEFEGDWYPWSLAGNGQDPAKYISAYRHVVDRFRSAGVTNVKWMWCLNAEPKPYSVFNYVVSCYPGDSYVDIVATDIYNHPNLGTPDWKSFRYTMAESYYYLAKHFSHKPLYICEVGCRERNSGEPAGSQTKGDWLCMMDKDLQTYFTHTRAVVFFSIIKEHDWRINSSPASEGAFESCIWSDNYYYGAVGLKENQNPHSFTAFPNPFNNDISLNTSEISAGKDYSLRIYNGAGQVVYSWQGDQLPQQISLNDGLDQGLYIIEIYNGHQAYRQKLMKN